MTSIGDAACSWTYEVPCLPDAGDAGLDACAACPTSPGQFCTQYDVDGATIAVCGTCCIGGRAPRGFAPTPPRGTPSGVRLAIMAQVEAASVDAFLVLHDDLARLGAPATLLRDVRTAADDEVRHARSVARAAERLGAEVPLTRVAPAAPRSLDQLAEDNAVEGCVVEAFGAALAAWQSERATDAGVRRLMRTVAREELAHADLAWRIAAWLDQRLDDAGRARVREARRDALARLERDLVADRAGDAVLGIPPGGTLQAMLRAMAEPLASGHLLAA